MRQVEVKEPRSSKIVFHLGMTKGALVAVAILTAAVIIVSWKLKDLADQGAQAHEVQCAQQKSQRKVVRKEVQYLLDVRTGKRPRIPGITDTDIIANISEDQRLLSTFDKLDC